LKGKYSNVDHFTINFSTFAEVGPFDKELISHFPTSLKSVSHNGAGYDQVDFQALGERGIQLSNTPAAVDNATADTHVFLLLGALRNFGQGVKGVLAGDWDKTTPVAHDPSGKVVGIVGLGGIGKNILQKLKPFGFAKFVYYNRNRLPEAEEYGAEYVSFDELLETSDIISINVPLNKNTFHLFNEDVLSKTKKGVVIVNTARGAVIDEKALYKYLTSGHVRSAGLDVLENEPNVNLELVNLPNVLALPHLGTYTVETRKEMEEIVIENVKAVIETGKVSTLVPELKSVEF
jgi:lactate dehydrogenase-like 2-hydroxyacid dehydrogenase